MKNEDKREILKHIKLGTKEVLYYPYAEGKQPLPLRPISTWELDDCFYKALEDTPDNIADFIVKVKLDLIDKKTNINVENTGYIKLMKFYNSIDYWIVYYSMKDFQDKQFSLPDYTEIDSFPKGFYEVMKMIGVHKIAKFVLSSSIRSEDVIKEIFKDEAGKEVASIYLYLNVPLAEMGDITKLQRDFMIYSKLHLGKIVKGEARKQKYSISGEKMTIKQVLDRFK